MDDPSASGWKCPIAVGPEVAAPKREPAVPKCGGRDEAPKLIPPPAAPEFTPPKMDVALPLAAWLPPKMDPPTDGVETDIDGFALAPPN